MSDKIARIHTNPSNRAKPKDTADRKVVYRSVLDNPFRVQWPPVSANLQNVILARIIRMLDGLSNYHLSRENLSRKRKRSHRGIPDPSQKKQRRDPPQSQATNEASTTEIVPGEHAVLPATGDSEVTAAMDSVARPPILQHITLGINEVTKLLEKATQSYRYNGTMAPGSQSARTEPPGRSRVVLVCRGDVDPPALIQHFPYLVAACNPQTASMPGKGTWLIALPKGAEYALAEAAGLRRVSALAVEDTAPDFSELLALIDQISLPRASWLALPASGRSRPLISTHIKQLLTTAPKNMKAAKEARTKGRAAAKERKKSQALAKKKMSNTTDPLPKGARILCQAS
ncbi:hypothetical protein WOLCODRAFT_112731 [Wolfiporia cocos MD-104 SS10]|uniref:Uncharacterized protein n=1 Tax=Wolfiporia cocos (strain MD-104) TaxID=742152 RepID=A0A2H3JD55_WOLCO|nr:hypothetical protein WOLCODRAFT_112731 [Wolfiporia cocos MD-104 SS10]